MDVAAPDARSPSDTTSVSVGMTSGGRALVSITLPDVAGPAFETVTV